MGSGKVVCGLSGGVDSTVAAHAHSSCDRRSSDLHLRGQRAAAARRSEPDQEAIRREDCTCRSTSWTPADLFLERLAGVTDPEQKRKIIGATFIDVFETRAKELGGFDFLGQGTLYPDVIESAGVHGPAVVIKSHHNVGGLPERMNFKLVEPLRDLFKDEVRRVGRDLGLDKEFVVRQPFPGPRARRADPRRDHAGAARAAAAGGQDRGGGDPQGRAGTQRLWQSFAVLLPVQSVGVMGDARTYEYTVAIRAVESLDGMTADWARLPHELLATISSRIVNEVRGINRVVYDISSKPPSTIEWE